MRDETPCARCRERLPWYAAGQLGADERERISEHLRACAACRQELAEWRAIAEGVKASSRAAQPTRAFEESWARLAERLPARPVAERAPGDVGRAGGRRAWPPAGWLPRPDVAALVVALAALVVALAGGRDSLPGWAVWLLVFALVCAGLAALRLGRDLARARGAQMGRATASNVAAGATVTRA
ncbi:MAG TPA: zf-HC2 domain-containing protein, partial [Ktedonobacterales bacterium]